MCNPERQAWLPQLCCLHVPMHAAAAPRARADERFSLGRTRSNVEAAQMYDAAVILKAGGLQNVPAKTINYPYMWNLKKYVQGALQMHAIQSRRAQQQ